MSRFLDNRFDFFLHTNRLNPPVAILIVWGIDSGRGVGVKRRGCLALTEMGFTRDHAVPVEGPCWRAFSALETNCFFIWSPNEDSNGIIYVFLSVVLNSSSS